ncbi:hypothetical protein [Leptolyngbya sp. FACHB-16]|uniref:hypothetical protein n=1 Tax=unclassified Leptolyngbya TaxID=2650499 RepID=UPI00168703CA|nr:hypothetical protein [Leptolyngbya sp. FACHB-16]MBD2155625.1 hypothetical protein [Leptolyngbya sp. FACHB-16]
MKHITVEYRRQSLSMVTLSLGVASFPQHGSTAEGVICWDTGSRLKSVNACLKRRAGIGPNTHRLMRMGASSTAKVRVRDATAPEMLAPAVQSLRGQVPTIPVVRMMDPPGLM